MERFPIKDVEITRIASFDKRKDGTPLVTKPKYEGQEGKPYKNVLIDLKTNDVDDVSFTGTVSMLDFDGVSNDWSEGTRITGDIVKNGDYWNFELPKPPSLKDAVDELTHRVEQLEKAVYVYNPDTRIATDEEGEELPF